jgi:hypothetical protein
MDKYYYYKRSCGKKCHARFLKKKGALTKARAKIIMDDFKNKIFDMGYMPKGKDKKDLNGLITDEWNEMIKEYKLYDKRNVRYINVSK